MLQPGDTAPDFTLSDQHGNRISLSDYRGQPVVVWFYPKADTPGCTKEGCAFQDQKGYYDQHGVAILGISFDTPEENEAFADKYGFEFPLLSDTSREVGIAYGAAEDASAQAASRIGVAVDGQGRVAHVETNVQPGVYPAEVLSLFAEGEAG